MKLEISNLAGTKLAYLRLGRGPVSHTVELRPSVLIDLDQYDCVIGVEILDITKIPSPEQITSVAHVKDSDKANLELGLTRLSRVKTSSSSLTDQSQLRAEPINYRELELS